MHIVSSIHVFSISSRKINNEEWRNRHTHTERADKGCEKDRSSWNSRAGIEPASIRIVIVYFRGSGTSLVIEISSRGYSAKLALRRSNDPRGKSAEENRRSLDRSWERDAVHLRSPKTRPSLPIPIFPLCAWKGSWNALFLRNDKFKRFK